MTQNLGIFIASFIFCGIVFIAIGIWAFVRKTPMHFWAGSVVLPETITNVKKYNRANGIMWCVFSIIFFATALIASFDFSLAFTFGMYGTIIGIILLILIYLLIKRHFYVIK